jgi:hypothetical protein
MLSNALARLQGVKEKSDQEQVDRALYAAVMQAFEASGWWSSEQLLAYRALVAQLMRAGSADDKQAAREFWADRAGGNAALGINARMRERLAHEKT